MDKTDAQARPTNDLLANTAKGASYLIMLQLVSRMITFSLNQTVLRYTTPGAFGIASVNLELLASTILFISREGFRAILIRSSKNQQQIINLAYIPACLGLFTTTLCCGYYLSTITLHDSMTYPYYSTSVILYGLASFLELSVEPLFIFALNKMYFQLRVGVEGIAVVSRCLTSFGMTLYGKPEYSVLSFALAQLVYGFVIMTGYIGYFLYKEKSLNNLLPRKIKDDNREYWFDKTLLHLGINMTKQSLLKHILTEGDKMLISALSTDADKGVYGFVSNYGTLVVRILFQPLEETARTFFSKCLSDKQNADARKSALSILTGAIQFHILLGLVFICFATNYTSTLIDLLAGPTWSIKSSAPTLLAVYCTIVPFMGINGITEGFVQAVASEQEVSRLSYFMVLFSACFMVSGFVFMYILELGAMGLIFANMINLSIRILYSWQYICSYFGTSKSVRSWFPHPITALCFVLSWVVTSWSEINIGWFTIKQKLMHILVGALCFLFVCVIIFWKEKSISLTVRQLMKSKKS